MTNVEAQTIKNTEDISKVTAAVDKLALTMQFEMERGKEERENIKMMVNELRGLNDKIGTVAVLNEKIAQLQTDVAILQTGEKVCKEWRDKHDGATKAMGIAVKAMWAVCGTGVVTVGGFVLYLFFTHQSPVLLKHINGNAYYGRPEATADE